MKKLLACSTAALAIGMAPASAMAADGNIFDGFGSISMGYNSLDEGSWTYDCDECTPSSGDGTGKADGLDIDVRVSAAVPLSQDFGAQVDGEFTRTVYKLPAGFSDKINDSTIAAHGFWRNPDKGLAGLIVQRTSSNTNWNDGIATYYIGGEGQFYAGNFTVYGQVVYGTEDATPEEGNGVNGALQLRYFPQPNLMVALRGGYENIKMKPNSNYGCCWKDTVETWAIGAKGEYRLNNSRVSLLADIDYRDIKEKNRYDDPPYWTEWNGKYHDVRAMVGVKLNFGASTLLERDRSGASLDPVRPLGSQAYYVSSDFDEGSVD